MTSYIITLSAARNVISHGKIKHIQVRYYFILTLLKGGQISMEKTHIAQNPTDILTKVVTRRN